MNESPSSQYPVFCFFFLSLASFLPVTALTRHAPCLITAENAPGFSHYPSELQSDDIVLKKTKQKRLDKRKRKTMTSSSTLSSFLSSTYCIYPAHTGPLPPAATRRKTGRPRAAPAPLRMRGAAVGLSPLRRRALGWAGPLIRVPPPRRMGTLPPSGRSRCIVGRRRLLSRRRVAVNPPGRSQQCRAASPPPLPLTPLPSSPRPPPPPPHIHTHTRPPPLPPSGPRI